MYLFFDTETTGVPGEQYALHTDTTNWPRVVQIAWTLTDENGNETRAQSFIVRPNGFEIPASATSVHGITTETARRLGIEIDAALNAFANDVHHATTIVAHNANFDERVVGAEFVRARRYSPLEGKIIYCTMRTATDVCKLKGRGGNKWPSLSELHHHLFSTGFETAHDALSDVHACARCFFELKRREITFGPDENDPQVSDDQALFDEIYDLASSVHWFDTSRFVDNVYAWFQSKGFITSGQRSALENIRDMLEERAY